MTDTMQENVDALKKEATEYVAQGKETVKASAEEWWGYIQTHPLQSMLFGVIGYFAVKGFFK